MSEKFNEKILRKVQRHIRKHPEGFDMHVWSCNRTGSEGFCGTAACIAGWTVNLAKKSHLLDSGDDWPDIAASIIDPVMGYEPFEKLFHTHSWPDNFKAEYAKIIGIGDGSMTRLIRKKAIADLACRVIDHFIKEHAPKVKPKRVRKPKAMASIPITIPKQKATA